MVFAKKETKKTEAKHELLIEDSLAKKYSYLKEFNNHYKLF